MNRKNSILAKILLILFAFNCFSLYLYFSHHNNSNILHHLAGNRRFPFPENHHVPPQQHLLKPWPTLASYLPWSQQNPDVKIGSCEAYFGNGFTRRLDILPPSRRSDGGGGGGGWFRCMYSETLRSSICEGGRLRMWPERIKMSKGGERIEDVFGRREEDELPVFEDGAFEVDGNGKLGFWRKSKRLVGEEFLRYVTDGSVSKHAMRELIGSIQVVGGRSRKFECDQWVEEPTILVTRYEYANLFHTITDWYSAYVASRVTGLPHRPHLVFVDGHCKTPLEETWKALFSSVRHAKNFTGSVCFHHAILSPLGYDTPLFKGLTEEIDCKGTSAQDLWQNPDNYKTARLSEFGEMIKAAFGFSVTRPHIHKPALGHNVLFVRREDYLAHPRHKGKVESRLSNEEEVFNSIKDWASNYMQCKINLVNGLFAHMSMKEQLQAIQDASIIIGAHGAGLTHIVSAMPKTVILEIVSSHFRRPHFELIAQWKGLEYKAIYLSGSHADPPDVINKLSSIVGNLGC